MKPVRPQIGSKISLTTKSQIRYIGTLSHVDPVDKTLTLENVKCMGTEQRRTSRYIPSSSKVSDSVIFSGLKVESIELIKDTRDDEFEDPAIIKISKKNEAVRDSIDSSTGLPRGGQQVKTETPITQSETKSKDQISKRSLQKQHQQHEKSFSIVTSASPNSQKTSSNKIKKPTISETSVSSKTKLLPPIENASEAVVQTIPSRNNTNKKDVLSSSIKASDNEIKKTERKSKKLTAEVEVLHHQKSSLSSEKSRINQKKNSTFNVDLKLSSSSDFDFQSASNKFNSEVLVKNFGNFSIKNDQFSDPASDEVSEPTLGFFDKLTYEEYKEPSRRNPKHRTFGRNQSRTDHQPPDMANHHRSPRRNDYESKNSSRERRNTNKPVDSACYYPIHSFQRNGLPNKSDSHSLQILNPSSQKSDKSTHGKIIDVENKPKKRKTKDFYHKNKPPDSRSHTNI